MARVVNVGKRDRMVADEILRPGEGKIVSMKMAMRYEGDPELKVIVDVVEAPKAPEVADVREAPKAPEVVEVKKSKGKRSKK